MTPLLYRFLPLLTLVVSLLGWSLDASAACKRDPRGSQFLSFQFSNARITVPRDAPIGTVLASQNAYQREAGGIWCNPGTYISRQRGLVPNSISSSSTSSTGLNGVYVLPNAGFGFRIVDFTSNQSIINSGSTISPSTGFPSSSNCPNTTQSCSQFVFGAHFRMELVKTANFITNPTFSDQNLVKMSIDGVDYIYFDLLNSLTIVPQTCQVSTPSVVPLTSSNGLNVTSFTGVGSTSTPVAFSLGVNCSGVAAQVAVTFTDTRNPGNTGTTLPLTATSVATGLGVQILRNNVPINFGPDSSVARATNQIQLFTATGSTGLTNVPFTARYIQTAARVTAGSANSLATFTMSYQ